ncbi:MAG: phBC6A51 family helix-turn-helix protein [Candidatus Doudnabacteria bacterium]|nr:phBC6A51 family helix-turn-helix protein [Candidatus Doudnabacteria bacterium]
MDEQQEVVLLPEADEEGGNKYSSASDHKQAKQKEMILEQLRKTPVIQIVCEKLGISRSSYYRWRQDDKDFAKACDDALEDGCLLINDLAESQLMGAIRDQNITAIIFWLRSHHDKYKNKMEVSASIKNVSEQLTPEQQAVVEQALKLASLIDAESPEHKESANGRTIRPEQSGQPGTNSAPATGAAPAEQANAGSESVAGRQEPAGNQPATAGTAGTDLQGPENPDGNNPQEPPDVL